MLLLAPQTGENIITLCPLEKGVYRIAVPGDGNHPFTMTIEEYTKTTIKD
jgi:hypothetical protein